MSECLVWVLTRYRVCIVKTNSIFPSGFAVFTHHLCLSVCRSEIAITSGWSNREQWTSDSWYKQQNKNVVRTPSSSSGYIRVVRPSASPFPPHHLVLMVESRAIWLRNFKQCSKEVVRDIAAACIVAKPGILSSWAHLNLFMNESRTIDVIFLRKNYFIAHYLVVSLVMLVLVYRRCSLITYLRSQNW